MQSFGETHCGSVGSPAPTESIYIHYPELLSCHKSIERPDVLARSKVRCGKTVPRRLLGRCQIKFLLNEAPWLLEFERELFASPAGRRDDQVDAFALALRQATKRDTLSWPSRSIPRIICPIWRGDASSASRATMTMG